MQALISFFVSRMKSLGFSSVQMAIILKLIATIICCHQCNASLNATMMTSILKEIKATYDSSIPPVEGGLPVNVSVQMSIMDMFPYQSIHMHYSADFFLKLHWYDYRLALNKSDNHSFIPAKGGFLWRPDIYFPQGRQGDLQNIPSDNEGSHFYLNGTVVHVQRITLVSLCLMELHYYPFDIQNCSFEISTITHTQSLVRLNWALDPILVKDATLDMKEFNIVKFNTDVATSSFGRNGNFDTLQLKFRFYRYLAFYFLRDFFPCILIVVLSWMTFWIDYESTPARVAMGITTVLTIVTMTNNIRNHSPPAGLFRSIDYYLLMCNLFVFAALLEYALVGMKPNNRKRKHEKRKEQQSIDLYNMDNMKNLKEHLGTIKTEKEEKNEKRKQPARVDHRIDRLSRVLFPIMFAVFNAIYFAFHRLHDDTVD